MLLIEKLNIFTDNLLMEKKQVINGQQKYFEFKSE